MMTKATNGELGVNYITIDMTVTDAAKMISGDVNGEVIQWIRANSHRVVAKKTADGQVTVCQLKDDDGTKYYDGTDASADIKANDVFMRLPRFFYHAEETSTDVWKIGFAQNQVDSTWKEWDGRDLIGVYEGCEDNGLYIRSLSGMTSSGDMPQSSFKKNAAARGTGYSLVKWKHHCIMAMLYYAQYGHTNCQAKIGAGTDNYSFWGLENWWGNKFEWIDNVVVDNGLWKITEDDGSVRQVQAGDASGWITKVAVGEHLDMVPTAVGGSDTTGLCDYYNRSSSYSRVVQRSNVSSNTYGGVACARADHDASYTYPFIGSRLAFRGEIVEAESVSAFQSITP